MNLNYGLEQLKICPEILKDTPIEYKWEIDPSSFDVIKGLTDSGDFGFKDTIACTVTALSEYGRFKVKGKLTGVVTARCSRCLVEYSHQLSTSFTIYYTRSDGRVSLDEEEIELTDEDLVTAYFSGDEIDISHEIAEQLVMAMPMKPLCGEGCKGLCHSCGINLNMEHCECLAKTVSFSFSALLCFKVK